MKTLKQKAYQLAMKRFEARLKKTGTGEVGITLALLHGMDFLNLYQQALKDIKKHENKNQTNNSKG